MSNSAYKRKKASGLSALVESKKAIVGKSYVTESIIDGSELTYTVETIESSEVFDKTVESPYNHRSADLITEVAVQDILPSIRENGRNTEYAIGVRSGDKIEVLLGLRRRFCIGISPGTVLHIYVFENMSEEEKYKRCKTGDMYMAPTPADLALKIAKYKEAKSNEGDKVSVRDLASVFGISSGKVSELLRFGSFDESFFRLFPSLFDIPYTFLRDVLKLSTASEISVDSEFVSKFDAVSPKLDEKAHVKAVKELRSAIIQELKPIPAPPKPRTYVSYFDESASYLAGVKVVNTEECAVIHLDHDKVSSEVQEKIKDLLELQQ